MSLFIPFTTTLYSETLLSDINTLEFSLFMFLVHGHMTNNLSLASHNLIKPQLHGWVNLKILWYSIGLKRLILWEKLATFSDKVSKTILFFLKASNVPKDTFQYLHLYFHIQYCLLVQCMIHYTAPVQLHIICGCCKHGFHITFTDKLFCSV